jgi:phosphate:Na+ symporter
MKDGFAPLKDIPAFTEAFAWFRADNYFGIFKCIVIGCVLTFLVQSSSATLGITIGLASTGSIPFTTAAALVLGENIGTTITVVLASIGANANAKRAAYAHVLFNVLGVAWIALLFPFYIRLIIAVIQNGYGVDPSTMVMADFADPLRYAAVITSGIALTHSGFNIANTLLFLPFLRPFAKLLYRLVPEPMLKEVSKLRHLDANAVSSPVLAVEQSRGEVVQMGRGVVKMVDWIRQLVFTGPYDIKLVEKVFHREEILDNVQREVVAFLTDTLDATLPHAIAEEGRQQLRIAHEFESMSDRLASGLRAFDKLRDRKITMPADQKDGVLVLHNAVADFVISVTEAYAQRTALSQADAQAANAAITRLIRRLRDDHMVRMTEGPVDPNLTLAYTGILTDYRRIRAHAYNVHEATVAVRALDA